MSKKVIVTGGLGFIGSNLVKLLLKKKYKVINIDKITYSANPYNLKDISKNKNYFLFKVDINNKKQILKIFNKFKPDVIFNLAAETHVDRSIENSMEFIKSNVLGVHNLLEVIKIYIKKKKSFKMLHISTDEVYGDINHPYRSKENDKHEPSSPYSASKSSADNLIKSYVKTFKLPIIVSNCCNNYGPNQHPEKLIPKIIYNLQKNKNIPIYAKGLNSREWIYVGDHCEALIKIYKSGQIGETYNVGSGKNLRNIDIAKIIIKTFKSINIKNKIKSKIKFVKDRPGHDFRYALNSNKIKNKLNWKSKTNFYKGIKKTISWYMNNLKYYRIKSKKNYEKRIGLIK